MKPETEHHILEQAAFWFARQENNALNDADKLIFDDWLAASERHRAVYHEVSGVWQETALLERPVLHNAARPLTVRETAAQNRNTGRQTGRASGQQAGAFSFMRPLTAAVGFMLCFALGGSYIYDVPTRIKADAYTATGQSKYVSLPDGSTAELNTSSAIEILYTPQERAIRLLKGEALFTVAPDKTRPFRILTREGGVTALGTIYAVKQDKNSTDVTVLESKVQITGNGDDAPQAVLHANEQASFTGTAVSEIHAVDSDTETAWRRGKLIVNDRPLEEVIAELNRYHPGTIRITDSTIGRLRISGVFETRETANAVKDLENALHIRSTRLSDYIILLHR